MQFEGHASTASGEAMLGESGGMPSPPPPLSRKNFENTD